MANFDDCSAEVWRGRDRPFDHPTDLRPYDPFGQAFIPVKSPIPSRSRPAKRRPSTTSLSRSPRRPRRLALSCRPMPSAVTAHRRCARGWPRS